MGCDIIIPVWNESEATKRCLDSVVANTGCPYKLLIIDNGSVPDTAEYLASFCKGRTSAQLVRNNSNLGFARAVNQGLRISTERYLCVLNNDTVVAPGWLEEMISALDSDPSIGIVNPSSNTTGQVPAAGESAEAYASRLKADSGKTQELYNARGFCMLISRELVGKIGLFDETFGLGYFEETDYSARAHAAGYRAVRAKASYVYHEEGTSFKRVKGRDDLFKRNESYFVKKWGRPVMLGCIVGSESSGTLISRAVNDILDKGHRIVLVLKKGVIIPALPDHFNLKVIEAGGAFFGLSSLVRMIKRMRKKGLDLIVTDSAAQAAFLYPFASIRGTGILVSPGVERIKKLLEKLSRVK